MSITTSIIFKFNSCIKHKSMNEIILNHDHEKLPSPVDSEEKSLSRLKLAI